MICGAQWKVKCRALVKNIKNAKQGHSRAWNQIRGLWAEAVHPAGLQYTQTKEVGLRWSQMLLLESDHLRWKRGKSSYAKHAGKEVLGKGNSLHRGPQGMGKMEYSRTWKCSRVVQGGKKGRGQCVEEPGVVTSCQRGAVQSTPLSCWQCLQPHRPTNFWFHLWAREHP